mgnify:CR=1 FL=1
MWFVEPKPEIVTTPTVEAEKKDVDVGASSNENDTKMIDESKITTDLEKKGSASDDEEIEEERSWRRGYDGE